MEFFLYNENIPDDTRSLYNLASYLFSENTVLTKSNICTLLAKNTFRQASSNREKALTYIFSYNEAWQNTYVCSAL